MREKFLLIVFPALSFSVHAEIIEVQGGTAAAIQEFLEGEPASLNSDDSEGALPVGSLAELETTGLEGALIGKGRTRISISSLAGTGAGNPEELTLEAACFSNDASVSYLVESSASETREVFLHGSQIDGRGRGRSNVWLSGAVLIWSMQESLADDLEVSFHFSIARNESQMVLETGLVLQLDRAGSATIDAQGRLAVEEVSLNDLAVRGIDDESLEILRNIEDAGRLVILVIPFQQLSYNYAATAGQPLTLTARMEASLKNAPDGTGAAITLGRPFSELTEFVDLGLPGVSGLKMQEAVNGEIAARDPNGGESTSPTAQQARPCGILGTPALLMLAICFAMTCRAGRCRYTRSTND